MCRSRSISRRRLLRGAGGAVLALPWLELHHARAQAPRRRLVFFFAPEGFVPGTWHPSQAPGPLGPTLGSAMKALAPYQRDLLITKGLHITSSGRGVLHGANMSQLLTNGTPTSVDQLVAAQIGKSHRFASLEVGAKTETSRVASSRLSYLNKKPVPPSGDPAQVFRRLFTSGSSAPASADGSPPPPVVSRASIIDAVRAELSALTGQLGAADRAVLDAHLTSLRAVERSLAPATPSATAPRLNCGAPAKPGTGGSLADIGKAQLDLLVLALTCDLTPVATMQWAHSAPTETYPWLGGTRAHHELVHSGGGEKAPPTTEMLQKISAFYVDQFAYFLERLKETPEDGRSVLDHSAVVWMSDFSTPYNHSFLDTPFLVAGSCGGAIRTGRFVDFGGESHGRFLAALAEAVGARVPGLGATPLSLA